MILQLILMIAFCALAALVRPRMPLGRDGWTTGARTVWFFIGVVMVAYVGFRDGDRVMDYGSYVDMYEQQRVIVEPTLTLISMFVKKFMGDNVVWLFVIYAAIAVPLKMKAIRQLTPLVFLSLTIYLSETFILHELTQIRAGVAAGFLLVSIKPLYERRGWRFCGLIACAVLFHVSALPAFLLWFLNSGRINKWLWVSLIGAGYVLAIMHFDIFRLITQIPIPYIQNKATAYILFDRMQGETVDIFRLYFLAKLGITLYLLWRAGAIAPHNRYVYLLLKIMLISNFSLLLFSTNVAGGIRFSEFFGAVHIVLFPMIYYTVRQKHVAWAAVVLLAALLFYAQVFIGKLILPPP
jgi:hypothetical protein